MPTENQLSADEMEDLGQRLANSLEKRVTTGQLRWLLLNHPRIRCIRGTFPYAHHRIGPGVYRIVRKD